MKRTSLLRRVGLLQDLPDPELDRIGRSAREETVPADVNVVEIGDPGHSLYLILEGEVRVLYPARSADFELARLGPGECFGEMALLNDRARSATVQTVSETRLLVLDQEQFKKILLESPRAAVQLLETLSLRIRNADEQISVLSDKAMRDTLTGLLNRRAFHERLQEEADRNRRYGDEFALILLDVDRFKAVNDTFGHHVGDQILTWLGRLFDEHTRSADVPFRIGGEEFAILAPGTGSEITGTVAERLVQMVAEARPPVESELRITVSAGFANSPDDADDPARLFDLADRALLQAKADGRNRVGAPAAGG